MSSGASFDDIYAPYEQAQRRSYDEQLGALSRMEQARSKPVNSERDKWLAIAEGFGKPSRGGHFSGSLSNAIGAWRESETSGQDREMQQAEKLAAIQAARARLTGGFAKDRFDTQLGLPGMRTKYRDEMEDLNSPVARVPFDPDEGEEDYTSMPKPSQAPATRSATPLRSDIPPPVSPVVRSDAPARPPGFEALRGRMAAPDAPVDPSIEMPDFARGAPPASRPVGFVGAGEPPAPAPAPAPARPAPSFDTRLVDWASRVREHAVRNPDAYLRNPKLRADEARAEKIWNEYQQERRADATSRRADQTAQRTEMIKATEKQRNALGSATSSALNLGENLDYLDGMVKKHGFESLPNEASRQMRTAYTDALMQMKNVYELGALAGPDLDILEGLLLNPTVQTWDGMKSFLAQSKVVREIASRALRSNRAALGDMAPPLSKQAAERLTKLGIHPTYEAYDAAQKLIELKRVEEDIAKMAPGRPSARSPKSEASIFGAP